MVVICGRIIVCNGWVVTNQKVAITKIFGGKNDRPWLFWICHVGLGGLIIGQDECFKVNRQSTVGVLFDR